MTNPTIRAGFEGVSTYYVALAFGANNVLRTRIGAVHNPTFANTLEWVDKGARTLQFWSYYVPGPTTAARTVAIQALKDNGSGSIAIDDTIFTFNLPTGFSGLMELGGVCCRMRDAVTPGAGETPVNGFSGTTSSADANGILVWSHYE